MNEITMDQLMKKDVPPAETNTNALAEVEKHIEITPEDRQEIDRIKSEINFMDSGSLTLYGSGVQDKIASFNNDILKNIRSKDTGDLGKEMTSMVLTLKNSDISKVNQPKGITKFIPFLNSSKRAVEQYFEQYNSIATQIDKAQESFKTNRMELIKDAQTMDKLFEENLNYFKTLELYIHAGEERLKEVREIELPKLRKEAADANDPMQLQLVNDFAEELSRFEVKLSNLKISKTIATQTAPQIRMIRNGDLALAEQINTLIAHVIPTWRTQAVLAISNERTRAGLDQMKAAKDFTENQLIKNSEMLKQNALDVAKSSQESIVDVKSLSEVNKNLIETLDGLIQTQAEGHTKRQQAEQELLQIENDLKSALQRTITNQQI